MGYFGIQDLDKLAIIIIDIDFREIYQEYNYVCDTCLT
jgi:hypothetical protein